MKTQFGWILLLCLITVALALPVMAADSVMSGNCGANGDNVTWTYDESSGVLTISGVGEMENYTTDSSSPWRDHLLTIQKIVIESGVTRIGDYAFKGCSQIDSIEIPNSITTIGQYAFEACTSLVSVNLPTGITNISNYMFMGCSSLTNVNIPNSVQIIGTGAFLGCSKLPSIKFPQYVTTIGDYAFMSCSELKTVNFEKNAPSMNANLVFHETSGELIIYCYEGTTGWESLTSCGLKVQKMTSQTPQTGYTANLSASPTTTTVNQQVEIIVEANKTFAASDLSLTYDPAYLTFIEEQTKLEDIVQDNGKGTLRIVDFGTSKTSYTLVFNTIKAGTTNVTLSSAAFSTAEDAATEDLTTATIENGIVSVTVNPTVILPSDGSITGSDTAVYGETYTFKIVGYDTNNNYDIIATMGGEQVTVTNNGNGEYSIASVTDTLVISVTVKPKTYTVTFSKETDMTGLPDTADVTYGILYSIGLPVREHYTAKVTAYYDTSEKPAVDYYIENGYLKIAGNVITDNIVIEFRWKQVDATVTVTGGGDGDVTNFSDWAVYGNDYTLTVNQNNAYAYTVTATVNGNGVNLTNGGNVYTLSKDFIPEGAVIIFTVEKTLAMNISLSEYLTLNGGQKLYLILNTVDKVDGMVYCYGDTAMLWSDKYKAYCTLTEASSTLTANEITLTSSAGSSAEIDYSLDINNSGKIDANDAQFVYNMYTTVYSGITETVTTEKYLRADINGDKKVDTEDAAAIVYQILYPNGINS